MSRSRKARDLKTRWNSRRRVMFGAGSTLGPLDADSVAKSRQQIRHRDLARARGIRHCRVASLSLARQNLGSGQYRRRRELA